MNSRAIVNKLKKDGWYKVGGKGDHEKFKHPIKSGHVIVPHPTKDIKKGTLASIYKQAGWR